MGRLMIVLLWGLVCTYFCFYIHLDISIQKFIRNVADGIENVMGAVKALIFPKPPRPIEDYKEYETPKTIARIWHDYKLAGTCDFCGCSDDPIAKVRSGRSKCKWCAELELVTHHLRNHGTRRLLKK